VGCSNAGWSAVTSAGANTTLAGVLAGFMLNGIVILLSRTMTDIGKVRALGLLFAAFVALGLDSYLFGLVTGDSSCHRAWTEAMLAAGLLGMGAVAIIAGFGLLVAEYVEKTDTESTAMLKMLFNFLRFGVALIVLALLFMTSWNYLYAVLGNHVPGYAEDLLWAYLGIGLAGLAAIIANAWLPKSWTNKLIKAVQKITSLLPEKRPRKLVSVAGKISGWLAGPRDFKPRVNRAIYSSFGYTIVSVVGATFFARTSPQHWDQPDTLVTAAFIATVGWVLIAGVVPSFYLLVRCSPPFGDGSAGRGSKPDAEKDPDCGAVGVADSAPTPTKTKPGMLPLAEQFPERVSRADRPPAHLRGIGPTRSSRSWMRLAPRCPSTTSWQHSAKPGAAMRPTTTSESTWPISPSAAASPG
jgi:hypothetical protein